MKKFFYLFLALPLSLTAENKPKLMYKGLGILWMQKTESDGSESFFETSRPLGGHIGKATLYQERAEMLPETDYRISLTSEELDTTLQNAFLKDGTPVLRNSALFTQHLQKNHQEITSLIEMFYLEIQKLQNRNEESHEFSMTFKTLNKEDEFAAKIIIKKTNHPTILTVKLTTYSPQEITPDHLIHFLISALFVPGKNNGLQAAAYISGMIVCTIMFGTGIYETWNKWHNKDRKDFKNILGLIVVGGPSLYGCIKCGSEVYKMFEKPYYQIEKKELG